ncbi:hypothetical protein PoB_003853100 [Plakobranchus ocellatus]|uniref:Uncharacterized protein n=1 Tax=Plakobranchus ocellatus TaxID=259542 RepID=A0AAV4ALG6_9GAST|nr:hypothetical protein PoB_003853100 [Plakobranchus ocellatus]
MPNKTMGFDSINYLTQDQSTTSDLKFLGSLQGQGDDVMDRTHNKEVTADLRPGSLSTVPPTPPTGQEIKDLIPVPEELFCGKQNRNHDSG